MHPLTRGGLVFLLFSMVLTACAHTSARSGPEAAKVAAEEFLKRIRWKDYSGAAAMVLPERREAFEKARRDAKDDQNLSITDEELLSLKMDPSGEAADAVARINWTRMPSVTERSATVTSRFVFRDSAWWLAGQDGGPFAEMRPETR